MIPTYSSFILELPYKGAYQDEIDEWMRIVLQMILTLNLTNVLN
jgi:hypothetical protein